MPSLQFVITNRLSLISHLNSNDRSIPLRGQCLASGFFHESVSPQPQSISLELFQIFSKICKYIRKSRCTTGINNTGGVNDTGGKIADSINDTGGKFATGINDIGNKICYQFANVVDTSGKSWEQYQAAENLK